MHRDGCDIIIVGAGVAGAALAYTLGMDGRRVCVIERDLTEPRTIVGELLQPGGYLKLKELGLQECVQEIDAQHVFGYALYLGDKINKVRYPLETYTEDVTGYSFHNGRFVRRLREKAMAVPSVRFEEGSVLSLIKENRIVKGVTYKSRSSDTELEAYAALTIICDGRFSNLRRALSYPKVETISQYVALILKDCILPYANHGHVVLGNPSAIAFYPISCTEIRCAVNIPDPKPRGEIARFLRNVIAHQVPIELHEAFIKAIEEGNIDCAQTKSLPAAPVIPTPGAVLIGDALNMRYPVTGGGMTAALSDVAVLRNLLFPLCYLEDAISVYKHLEPLYILRKPVASTVNIIADALHVLLSYSTDEARIELKEAWFDFMCLGGVHSTRSVALLAIVDPRPLSLVFLFLAVGVFAIGRQLMPFPSPRKVWMSARIILVGIGILFPILKAEGFRHVVFPKTIPAHIRAHPAPK